MEAAKTRDKFIQIRGITCKKFRRELGEIYNLADPVENQQFAAAGGHAKNAPRCRNAARWTIEILNELEAMNPFCRINKKRNCLSFKKVSSFLPISDLFDRFTCNRICRNNSLPKTIATVLWNVITLSVALMAVHSTER